MTERIEPTSLPVSAARELIANLQAHHPRVRISASSLSPIARSMATELGWSPEQCAETSGRQDYGAYLLEWLKPRMPTEISDLLDQGTIAVGAIEHPKPRAYVQRVEDGSHAIVLHTGLRDLIYRVARILSTHVTTKIEELGTVIGPSVHETARLITDVFWWLRHTDPPTVFGPEYPITVEQAKFAVLLATEAGAFLLAHEISHVFLGEDHEHAVATAFGLPADTQSEEHAADALALHLTLGWGAEKHQIDALHRVYAYAGAELVLQI